MNARKSAGVAISWLLTVSVFLSVNCAEPELHNETSGQRERKHPQAREQTLGPFKWGETTREEVTKELGELQVGVPGFLSVKRPRVGKYFKGGWTFDINEENGVITGVSYDAADIGDSLSRARTSRGVGIGSTLQDVEQAYGPPERVFTGRTSFVLRNSELGMIYVYPSRGIWIMLINQTPYSGSDDWRVMSIEVGNEDVIQDMFVGASSYSTEPVTPGRKTHIIAMYEEKYGKRRDLEIYDDYVLTLELAYFDRVKSLGEYAVSIFMIVPKDEKEAAALWNEYSEGRIPVPERTVTRIKKETALKYGLSVQQLKQLLGRVKRLRMDIFEEEMRKEFQDGMPESKR